MALGIGQPKSSPDPETDPGFGGTLSLHPWTHQNNISQSSFMSSEISRQSRVSSNRSSADIPRPGVPIDRSVLSPNQATGFVPLLHSNLVLSENDKLPTEVIMPAARAEKKSPSSHSSIHSASSCGKGSKMGAWLRKKRGFSVSSSTSAGGGSSAASD